MNHHILPLLLHIFISLQFPSERNNKAWLFEEGKVPLTEPNILQQQQTMHHNRVLASIRHSAFLPDFMDNNLNKSIRSK